MLDEKRNKVKIDDMKAKNKYQPGKYPDGQMSAGQIS